MNATAHRPATRAMVAVMRLAGLVQQRVGELCAAYGITHDQYNVLRILRGAHPHGHPRFEVAARLISRAPDVTRLLDRLERQGLVERVRGAVDRRMTVSRITDEGLLLLDVMDPEVDAVHAQLAGRLRRDAQIDLARLCETLL
jgi:DNA-binding MarR family transcriptional regulator